MKHIIKIILTLIPVLLFSQKNNQIIYINFDRTKDHHFEKKNKINYFDICIDNKRYVRFQYGIYNRNVATHFNKKTIDRAKLSTIITKDNPNQIITYIIVKKMGKQFILYKADHLFRKTVD